MKQNVRVVVAEGKKVILVGMKLQSLDCVMSSSLSPELCIYEQIAIIVPLTSQLPLNRHPLEQIVLEVATNQL